MRRSSRVDIAVPTFNDEATIEATLQSLLQQTLAPRRIVVVDDGSTDGTTEIVAGFERCGGVELRRNAKNLGLVGNWNECIRRCDGDYLLILHSDDWLHPTAVSQLDSLLNVTSSLGLIGLGAKFFETPTESTCTAWSNAEALGEFTVSETTPDRIVTALSLICSSVVVSRRAYEMVGMFSDEFPYSPDEEMWVRISAQWPIAVRSGGELVGVRTQGEHYMHQTWCAPDFVNAWRKLHERIDDIARQALDPQDFHSVHSMMTAKYQNTLKWIAADCKSRGVSVSTRLAWEANRGAGFPQLVAIVRSLLGLA